MESKQQILEERFFFIAFSYSFNERGPGVTTANSAVKTQGTYLSIGAFLEQQASLLGTRNIVICNIMEISRAQYEDYGEHLERMRLLDQFTKQPTPIAPPGDVKAHA